MVCKKEPATLALNIMDNMQQFLSVHEDFKLGVLPTEAAHLKTLDLSTYAKTDLSKGISLLKEIDVDAIKVLTTKIDMLEQLAVNISQVINLGNKVFLCGCGATGRLSLALETLVHFGMVPKEFGNQFISFMAGGDVALVKSVEKFEDYPVYGAKQLTSLGFASNDLLISSTEGGETPFVIGATEKACEISNIPAYFLYCNPDRYLIKHVKRSREVIENKAIKKINLFVGPMALSGSTRMQASTVLMLAIGLSIQKAFDNNFSIKKEIQNYIEFIENADFDFLTSFIEKEADIYKSDGFVHYHCDSFLGISVFTDTTERSPTFALPAFVNQLDKNKHHSLCYVAMRDTSDVLEAWEQLLGRKPRALDANEFPGLVGGDYLLGFDFSEHIFKTRKKELALQEMNYFEIYYKNQELQFKFKGLDYSLSLKGKNKLFIHIILKLLLNIHSTLIMGRLGRYQGNMMTWVKPSNNKLIDRAIRYILELLKRDAEVISYKDCVEYFFKELDKLKEGEAIVLKTIESIKKNSLGHKS